MHSTTSACKKALLTAMALATVFAALGVSTAAAAPKGEFVIFAECPTANAELSGCINARAEKGSITFGKETVPIVNTQVLQGGFIEDETGAQHFVAATVESNTLPKTPQKVPGGLSGLVKCNEISNKKLREQCEAIFENKITGVNAVIELAAPASHIGLNEDNLLIEEGTALSLPVKIKLENPLLGGECYIGSNASPINVELTTGTTAPPLPNKPIKGKLGEVSVRAEARILVIKNNSLVNNTVAAPGASGCGIGGLLNSIVNGRLGLPSASGHNSVVLEGTIEQTGVEAARESE
jgi:hypothetical protein